MTRIPSASQTVGPFFNFALTTNPNLGILARSGVPGERIRLEFRVTDGDGAPAPGDCMLELWQADSAGRYAQTAADFAGFGRLETGQDGACIFETVKPGRVAGPDGRLQAPHINVVVFARGLLIHLHTRVYFAGDPANLERPSTRTGSRGTPRHTTGTPQGRRARDLALRYSSARRRRDRLLRRVRSSDVHATGGEPRGYGKTVRGFFRRVCAAGDARFRSRAWPAPKRAAA